MLVGEEGLDLAALLLLAHEPGRAIRLVAGGLGGPESLEHRCLQGGVEDLEAPLAVVLGRIHGEVGVAQQLVGGDAGARRDRDSDARAHRRRLIVQQEGLAQQVEHAPGRPPHLVGAADVLEQDRELVPAQPRGRVAGPQAAAQPPGDARQQLVAGGVPQGVVDRLEVVEVEEQDRDREGGAQLARQRVFDAVAEQRAVGQLGQRIVEGPVAQLLLERAALADIAERDDDGLHLGRVEQVGAQGLHEELGAVPPFQPPVGPGALPRTLHGLREQRRHLAEVVWVHEGGQPAADQLVGVAAERPARRGVRREDLPARVQREDRLRSVVDEGTDPCVRHALELALAGRHAVAAAEDLEAPEEQEGQPEADAERRDEGGVRPPVAAVGQAVLLRPGDRKRALELEVPGHHGARRGPSRR